MNICEWVKVCLCWKIARNPLKWSICTLICRTVNRERDREKKVKVVSCKRGRSNSIHSVCWDTAIATIAQNMLNNQHFNRSNTFLAIDCIARLYCSHYNEHKGKSKIMRVRSFSTFFVPCIVCNWMHHVTVFLVWICFLYLWSADCMLQKALTNK